MNKQTITAHTAQQLRAEIAKAMDTARIESASGKKILGIDEIMVTVFYVTDDGKTELRFGIAPETVHTNATALKELIGK